MAEKEKERAAQKVEQLLLQQTEQLKYVFFWQPNTNLSGDEIDVSCLCQWQPSEFRVENDVYSCAEQYMMAEKARVFEDDETCKLIMRATDPKEMKALGRQVKGFQKDVWDNVKYSIVLNGNYFKFSQNEHMRDFLFSTGDSVLVEASPLDKVWGIGLGEDDEESSNPHSWKGLNLLGFALMEVRDDLRRMYENYSKINWDSFQDKTSQEPFCPFSHAQL